MPTTKRPRKGSLQFYPRKRASKFLHSVNWKPVSEKTSEPGILGFITYKVGMATAVVRDKTEKSMTSGKRVAVPVTILEAPNMKIFSVRFYRNRKPLKDIIVAKDKELKRKLKLPKSQKEFDSQIPENYDDIKIIAYSLPKQTSLKKTPDLIELAVNAENKLEFVKSILKKEISISDFVKSNLLDARALTKGKGTQGPVKRFGITLKPHKSEKGRRNPGSIAPWHPARVTFRTPMAGQLGLFSRIGYNNNLILSGSVKENDINPSSGFKHYGGIKSSYFVIKGSVHGPSKRQVLLTPAMRPNKMQSKKNYEFVELIHKTK